MKNLSSFFNKFDLKIPICVNLDDIFITKNVVNFLFEKKVFNNFFLSSFKDFVSFFESSIYLKKK